MKTIVNAENVSFDKLNDAQKEKAIDLIRERERESADNFFADSVIEDYKNDILPEYGIDDTVRNFVRADVVMAVAAHKAAKESK